MHWRRKWQPIPVFLPGESQGQGSLMGCHLWGRTESDTTEMTWQQQHTCEWKYSGVTGVQTCALPIFKGMSSIFVGQYIEEVYLFCTV